MAAGDDALTPERHTREAIRLAETSEATSRLAAAAHTEHAQRMGAQTAETLALLATVYADLAATAAPAPAPADDVPAVEHQRQLEQARALARRVALNDVLSALRELRRERVGGESDADRALALHGEWTTAIRAVEAIR